MKIVADTNALMLPFTDGTDLVEELTDLVGAFHILVPFSVKQELQSLAQGKDAAARAAAGALRMGLGELVPTDLPGDDGLLEVARAGADAVMTNDRRLAGEAKKLGLRVVQSRGRGRLHLL